MLCLKRDDHNKKEENELQNHIFFKLKKKLKF